MNQKRLLSFFLVTAVFLAPVLCPAQGLPNGVQKVTSAEGITEYSLNNGLHFLVFPDPSKPTITVNVTYLVGSRQEGSGEGGMAHLLEHMVFKGSTNHLNIMQELTEYSLTNGLHFLVCPDPPKPTITVNVPYLVGSRQEGNVDRDGRLGR